MSHKILAINPGSTSTKISLFENGQETISEKISHEAKDLAKFDKIIEQKAYRSKMILDVLKAKDVQIATLNAVVGRGGLLRPIPSGTYKVNSKMLHDLETTPAEHASNLGAIIASEIAAVANCPAFIVDPVVVDELSPLARYTGNKALQRKSIFHALNQKMVARKTAKSINKNYEDANFIVAHLGGGISVGAHEKGKVVDVNNALDGDGAFSPERSGGMPIGQWMEIVLSGKYDKSTLKKMIKGEGGFMSYLGTTDARFIEKKVEEKDPYYTEVQNAMCYQVAKEIGACATVLNGKVDKIIITGGLAYNPQIIKEISSRVSFIAPIEVIPGENEMESLYLGAIRVLTGEDKAKEY